MAFATLAQAQEAGFSLLPGRNTLMVNPSYPGLLFKLLTDADDLAAFRGLAFVKNATSCFVLGRYRGFWPEGIKLGYPRYIQTTDNNLREPGETRKTQDANHHRRRIFLDPVTPFTVRYDFATIAPVVLGVIALHGHGYGWSGLPQMNIQINNGATWNEDDSTNSQLYVMPLSKSHFMKLSMEVKLASTVSAACDLIAQTSADLLPDAVPQAKRDAWLAAARSAITSNANPMLTHKDLPGTMELDAFHVNGSWIWSCSNSKVLLNNMAEIYEPAYGQIANQPYPYKPKQTPWILRQNDVIVADAWYKLKDVKPLPSAFTVKDKTFEVSKLMVGLLMDPEGRPSTAPASISIDQITPEAGGSEQLGVINEMRTKLSRLSPEQVESIYRASGPTMAMATWMIDKADEEVAGQDA